MYGLRWAVVVCALSQKRGSGFKPKYSRIAPHPPHLSRPAYLCFVLLLKIFNFKIDFFFVNMVSIGENNFEALSFHLFNAYTV